MQSSVQKAHRNKPKLGVGLAGVLVNDCCVKVKICSPLKTYPTRRDVGLVLCGVEFDLNFSNCNNNMIEWESLEELELEP